MAKMTERSQEEILADISAAEKRVDELDCEIEALEEKVVELKKERNRLGGVKYGLGHNWSEILSLKDELEDAKLRDLHNTAKEVVWKGDMVPAERHVVVRVTPKRIFVSQHGHKYQSQYNKDGSPVSGWPSCKIDIEKTFGGPLE